MSVGPEPSSSATDASPTTTDDDETNAPTDSTDASSALPNETAAQPTRAEYLSDLTARLLRPIEGSRLWGWVGALAVTALAAIMRLVGLDKPARLVFDETYYVKQAYSLLTLGYEGQWEDEVDDAFASGDFSGLSSDPTYVVHPPFGKWLIAIGLRLLGPESIAGWRLSTAIAGTIAVLLVARIGRRLLGSTLLGTTAGLLLAVDGIHLTLSRVALLDVLLSTLVLAAYGTLLLDRDSYRRRLAERTAAALAAGGGEIRDPWGVRVGPRWWLVATGVLLGLACGVKWSAIFAVAVFGIVAVAWTVAARRAVGVRLWVGAGAVRDGLSAFVALVPTALITYVASWASWFASTDAYYRQWATTTNAAAEHPVRTWLPDSLNSLVHYHQQALSFHVGLDSEHSYSSHPAGWLLQLRPTSMAWRDVDTPDGASGRWVESILAVGNPVVWWGGAVALVVVIWFAVRARDWRAWAILAGYAAMYLPWFGYSAPFANRTIFTFYTVAFVPFVALALAYGLGVLLGPRSLPLAARRWRATAFVAFVVAALVVAAFFWPIWVGEPIPYEYWRAHMWVAQLSSLRIGWV